MSLENNLLRLKHYEKALKEAKKKSVFVGVLGDGVGRTVYQTGATIAEVAAKHEFGIGVPMRSWNRFPVNYKKAEIKKTIDSQFNLSTMGTRTVSDGLEIVGIKVTNIIKQAFRNNGYGSWKPLAPSTLKNSRANKQTLIDTGLLRQSIEFTIRENN